MGCVSDIRTDELGPQLYSNSEAPTRLLYIHYSLQVLKTTLAGSHVRQAEVRALLSSIESELPKFEEDVVNHKEDKKLLNERFMHFHEKLEQTEQYLYGQTMRVQSARVFLEQINRLRENPIVYEPILRKQLESFQSDDRTLTLNKKRVITFEGKEAWTEAIEFLADIEPCPPLRHMVQLSKFSYDHTRDMHRHKFFQHKSSNGLGPFERLRNYVNYEGDVGICIGQGGSAAEVLADLIVDDGSGQRNNRSTLFNPDFRFAGVYFENGLATLCFLEGMR